MYEDCWKGFASDLITSFCGMLGTSANPANDVKLKSMRRSNIASTFLFPFLMIPTVVQRQSLLSSYNAFYQASFIYIKFVC